MSNQSPAAVELALQLSQHLMEDNCPGFLGISEVECRVGQRDGEVKRFLVFATTVPENATPAQMQRMATLMPTAIDLLLTMIEADMLPHGGAK